MSSDLLSDITSQPSIEVNADYRRWYAVSGTRLYSVANLAGLFPDIGSHQPEEMGGVWAPPLKLLDGYWLAVRAGKRPKRWLTAPATWHIGPEGVTLSYPLPELGLRIERREWVVPDQPALVVEVLMHRHPEATWSRSLSLTCGLLARSDLHGAWLAERLGWVDGEDLAAYDKRLDAVTFHDSRNAWEVVIGATQTSVACQLGRDVWGPERTSGRGTGAVLWYRCRATPTQPAHLRFLIAGASSPDLSARGLFAQLARSTSAPARTSGGATVAQSFPDPLEQAQRSASEAFRRPFARCVLQSPDPLFNEAFAWAKASSAMLMLEVPGLGRAAMAGLPEFPWWFGCDLAYGVLPMLPVGQGDAATDSLRLLAKMGQSNGKVPHEVVSHGVVFHAGNFVETPLFARALYHTYRWTGDRRLLEDLFPFCLQGIEQQATGAALEPGELVPRGGSIVETPEMASGLPTLDVAAYLVEALDLLAALAGDLSRADLAARLRERAAQLRQHVREEWWLPGRRLFGDVYAARAELRALLDRFEAGTSADASLLTSMEVLRLALVQARGTAEQLEARQPWLFLHMVQALAADAGLPDREQAASLLTQLETPEWLERFGIVLNAATNRQVMTLPTGALAVGEARYGRSDAALAVMQRMAGAFGRAMPGMLSEYAPDGGCFLQLWSNYGIIWPVIHYLFGLRPDVAARRLVCVPQPPSAWPAARLSALPLGAMQAEIELAALPDGLQVKLELTDPDWTVILGAAVPPGTQITSATINGAPVALALAALDEHEERDIWLAPPLAGTARYELSVSWSRNTRFIDASREG